MVHSKNKILIISEGLKTEVNLINSNLKSLSEHFNTVKLEIIPFEGNIYTLYSKISEYNEEFEDSTTTIDVLKEMYKNDSNKLNILNQNISYIYLLFDFEYHDTKSDKNTMHKQLIKMQEYFDNETENGLLFISYPMIEAYRDFDLENLNNFKDNFISIDDSINYKMIVGERGINKNISKYDFEMFNKLIFHSICKMNYTIHNSYTLPDYKVFINMVVKKTLINKQFILIKDKKIISVVSLALLLFLTYYGEKYYKLIKK